MGLLLCEIGAVEVSPHELLGDVLEWTSVRHRLIVALREQCAKVFMGPARKHRYLMQQHGVGEQEIAGGSFCLMTSKHHLVIAGESAEFGPVTGVDLEQVAERIAENLQQIAHIQIDQTVILPTPDEIKRYYLSTME